MASAVAVIGVKSQNLTRLLCLLKYFYHYLTASLQETSAYSLNFYSAYIILCFLKRPHGSVILFTYRLSRLCIWKSYGYSISVCSLLPQTGMWSALQYDLCEFVVFGGVFLPPWKVASLF